MLVAAGVGKLDEAVIEEAKLMRFRAKRRKLGKGASAHFRSIEMGFGGFPENLVFFDGFLKTLGSGCKMSSVVFLR